MAEKSKQFLRFLVLGACCRCCWRWCRCCHRHRVVRHRRRRRRLGVWIKWRCETSGLLLPNQRREYLRLAEQKGANFNVNSKCAAAAAAAIQVIFVPDQVGWPRAHLAYLAERRRQQQHRQRARQCQRNQKRCQMCSGKDQVQIWLNVLSLLGSTRLDSTRFISYLCVSFSRNNNNKHKMDSKLFVQSVQVAESAPNNVNFLLATNHSRLLMLPAPSAPACCSFRERQPPPPATTTTTPIDGFPYTAKSEF